MIYPRYLYLCLELSKNNTLVIDLRSIHVLDINVRPNRIGCGTLINGSHIRGRMEVALYVSFKVDFHQ